MKLNIWITSHIWSLNFVNPQISVESRRNCEIRLRPQFFPLFGNISCFFVGNPFYCNNFKMMLLFSKTHCCLSIVPGLLFHLFIIEKVFLRVSIYISHPHLTNFRLDLKGADFVSRFVWTVFELKSFVCKSKKAVEKKNSKTSNTRMCIGHSKHITIFIT